MRSRQILFCANVPGDDDEDDEDDEEDEEVHQLR